MADNDYMPPAPPTGELWRGPGGKPKDWPARVPDPWKLAIARSAAGLTPKDVEARINGWEGLVSRLESRSVPFSPMRARAIEAALRLAEGSLDSDYPAEWEAGQEERDAWVAAGGSNRGDGLPLTAWLTRRAKEVA